MQLLPSKRGLVAVAFALLVAVSILSSPSGDSTEAADTPEPPAMLQEHAPPPVALSMRDISVEIERPQAARRMQPAVGLISPPSSTQPNCFHNKVMFQPVFCSKVADIMAKSFDVLASSTPEADKRLWNVVHIGSREAPIRFAELIDLFGDAKHGSAEVARALKRDGAPLFCGSCCECVSASENRVIIADYNATLVFPEDPKEMPSLLRAALFHPQSDPRRHLISLPANDVARCPAELAARLRGVVRHLLTTSTRVDVMTVDAWRCDTEVIAALVELSESAAKPAFLEFTMVSNEAYEKVVQSLERDYACFFLTTKPEGKKFRGIRQPNYPLAVRLTGCWRGIYDSFKAERYHISCHKHTDTALGVVLNAFTRMTHKGIHAGCSVGQRAERLKKFL